MQHVQELCGSHEALLDLCFKLFVRFEGKIQQRLTVTGDCGQFLSHLARLFRCKAAVARMERRNRLQEVCVRDPGDNAGFRTSRPQRLG
jgi:hypothetical protein